MEYLIRHATVPFGQPTADWDSALWQSADTLNIAHYRWEDSGHHPRTQARVLYDDRFLAVIFRVEDRYVRAVAEKFQDSVCLDSCAEFFVAPLPDSEAYFNFEVNCGGTMLLHRCPSTVEREAGEGTVNVSAADGLTIAIAHSLPHIVEPEIAEPTTWTVEYHVPFSLFASYFGADTPTSGTRWKGNFYKCGDLTSHPHWGSWAPVHTEKPSFHQPDELIEKIDAVVGSRRRFGMVLN